MSLSYRAHRALLAVAKALTLLGSLGMLVLLCVATVAMHAGAQPASSSLDSVVPRVVHVRRVDTTTTLRIDTTRVVRCDTMTDTLRVVPLALQRFDGGAGRLTITNGIPLVRGLATAATLDSMHVVVAGVERAASFTALFGRHPDGSLRAVLVQFSDSLADGAPVDAQLVIGTPYDTAALPRPGVAVTSPVPAAAALPTDPRYLIASSWGGPLSVAGSDTSAIVRQFESDYRRLEAAEWVRCGPKWDCGRTAGYDRAYIAYQAWLRTGDATLWYHATAMVDDYLTRYIAVNSGSPAWWTMTESMPLHYWATGSDRTRYQLRKTAEIQAWMTRKGMSGWMGGTYGDDRMRARALAAALDAARLEMLAQPADAARYYTIAGASLVYYGRYLTPDSLPAMVSNLLASQRKDGQFGGRYYSASTWSADSGGQSNYMVGMLLQALTRYYDEVSPDPRILAAVQRAVDDLWAREYDPLTRSFQYHSLRGTDEGATTPARPNPEPGLNAFLLAPATWLAATTGQPSNAQRTPSVRTLLEGLAAKTPRDWWLRGGKAFDEAFWHLFNTIAQAPR
ncbi:hypothetical protein J421_4651 (plasmid) [Gemmatirosa kalamazoonensis]|uniref:Uncharacterized protein n=1 Tax=Gemmatirosa kalamazoonensis TaxID=861299 RepID=W0RN70_9BACT|nr:hypothetical protein [Gemmatirosa kalamazoonensis]AHG92118.1 hypothetical protein J421_4583 [Gemmatirosa kalamazoonensis]AHG92186.1 hypothetical protein J421_4651 [Gemmatirosa kalamazoonensis]